MSLFTTRYVVRPFTTGYLFRDNQFECKLTPGYHDVNDWNKRTSLICLPDAPKFLMAINQEVLTRDNVALRFSFGVVYHIQDGETLLSQFSWTDNVYTLIAQVEQRLINTVQLQIRNVIAGMESESLNENRHALTDCKSEAMEKEVNAYGLTLEQAQVRDITFPKAIQDLFAKHLEAKIRAKSDLENARTVVATARALKNASELMKDDENIRFFQMLETISKIAEKGKHTFMIGDIQHLAKTK